MIKRASIAIFLLDLVTSMTKNSDWAVDERITFEVHETFTFDSDFRADTLAPQLERPPDPIPGPTRTNGVPILLKKLKKRQILPDIDQFRTWRIVTESRPEYVYDYEQFKAEYDREVDKLKQDQAKLNASDFIKNVTDLCGASKIYAIGPLTVKCLLEARYGSSSSDEIRTRASQKLSKIAYLWVVLLAIVFVYGFGHAGWCSEFCPFSFCYPPDGYERIKQYLALNPPGTLTIRVVKKRNDNEKTVIDKRRYKPTETERYLYNYMWNTIYRQD